MSQQFEENLEVQEENIKNTILLMKSRKLEKKEKKNKNKNKKNIEKSESEEKEAELNQEAFEDPEVLHKMMDIKEETQQKLEKKEDR